MHIPAPVLNSPQFTRHTGRLSMGVCLTCI